MENNNEGCAEFLSLIREACEQVRDDIKAHNMTVDEGADSLKKFMYELKIPTTEEIFIDLADSFCYFLKEIDYAQKVSIKSIKPEEDYDNISKAILKRTLACIISCCTSRLKRQYDTNIKKVIKSYCNTANAEYDDIIINTMKEYWARCTKATLMITDNIVDYIAEMDGYNNDIDPGSVPDYLISIMDETLYNTNEDTIDTYEEMIEYAGDDVDKATIFKLSNNINVRPIEMFNTYDKKYLF